MRLYRMSIDKSICINIDALINCSHEIRRTTKTSPRKGKALTTGTRRLGRNEAAITSHLENPEKDAGGSEFTVKIARVLGVSVDWLDDEIGEMLINAEKEEMDPRIEHVVKVMQSLPPYAVDAGVREID